MKDKNNKEVTNLSRIKIDIGDITKLKVDAIVNAANKTLLGGGGVDGAIHRAAGPELVKECRTLNGCLTGQAKATKAYNLPCKYVIHTVGPIYSGIEKDADDLANCYMNSLKLARELGVKSIACSAISTGVYGYPLDDATEIAVATVRKWMDENEDYDMDVIFSCFSEKVAASYRKIIGK